MRPLVLLLAVLLPFFGSPGASAQVRSGWRSATANELQAALPDRAPVGHERIETEMRTASGITDGKGHVIAAVVLITAGYSADGKYSHYFLVQHAIRVGELALPAGTYVIGWKRMETGLDVHFFDAATGAERGGVTAHQMPPGARVESFRIWPPGDKSILQIGRFDVPYTLHD